MNISQQRRKIYQKREVYVPKVSITSRKNEKLNFLPTALTFPVV